MQEDLAPLIRQAFETNELLRKILSSLTGSRRYNITVQIYTQATQVPLAEGCFAYMFTNVGDTTAAVNGMVVFPSATPTTSLGDSRTIAAHRNEIYTGNITLSFLPTVGAVNPNVEIVQLYYV